MSPFSILRRVFSELSLP